MRERRRRLVAAPVGSDSAQPLADARKEAAAIVMDARMEAIQIVADAKVRAESVERDARARLADTPLGREYADLQRRVDDLRAFEREYRSRLIAYLESSLKDLRTEVPND